MCIQLAAWSKELQPITNVVSMPKLQIAGLSPDGKSISTVEKGRINEQELDALTGKR